MVAKINNGSSLFGALTYNINKVQNGVAEVILTNKIIQNITGNEDLALSLAMRSFETYLCLNDRIKKPMVHISLNPDPKDNLTDDQLKHIAKDYLKKMGFGNQPFIVYKHADIDRRHIHIVTLRVDENGQKIPDTYEHYRSMKVCRELEQKYGLTPAIGNKNEFAESYIKKIDYRQGDIKRQISNTIRSICDSYRFHSFGEYNALLSCYHIQAKLVRGKRFGDKYNGIVYSATDKDGTIVSAPFKSSLFGKRFGFNGLERTMKKNTEKLKQSDYAMEIKPLIYNALKQATSKMDFIKRLQEKNIDTVFRENDSGRIYGVTFIDHKNRMVVNGSRLGKELSANVFNHIFNQSYISEINKKDEVLNTSSHVPSMFEQAFGLFHIQLNADDSEEQKFAYEMKKRKKKKRRRGRNL